MISKMNDHIAMKAMNSGTAQKHLKEGVLLYYIRAII